MKAILRTCSLVLLSFIALAQSVPGAGFDVISIKRVQTPGNSASTPPLRGGRLRFANVTVKDILSLAYYPEVDFNHIKGPNWIDSDRYDIEAVTTEQGVSEERYRQLLRSMLADRFKFAAHLEKRQEPVYVLVPDSKGMKLKATPDSSCLAATELTRTPNGTKCGRPYSFNGTHLEGVGMTTATLAQFLGLVSGRPVIDRTGHAGMVDIKIDFTPANQVSSDPNGPPSIFTALPEQLGLRLQPENGPVESLIIDHVEAPSDN